MDGEAGATSSARDAAVEELSRPAAPLSPWDRLVGIVGAWVPASSGGERRRSVPVVVVAAVVLAVVAVVAGWTVLRRPADPATSLPRVGGTEVTSTVLAPDGGDPRTASGAAEGTTTSDGVEDDDPVVVHVAGAVLHPGVVTVPAGSRAVDAVAAAGGLAPGADPDRVNLAAPVVDGMRLAIPLVGQAPPVELAPQGPGGRGGAAGAPGATAGPLDLNSADAAQLDELPGVGPSTAAAIVAHRDEHGPFRSVDALLDVRGIGEAKLEALRDLVTVSGG